MKTDGTVVTDESISPTTGLIESYDSPANQGVFSSRVVDNLWWALAGLAVIGTVMHVTILTTIFYPGFIATDSGSYLSQHTYGSPSDWRMVPMTLLFAGFMHLSQGNIFGIVLPQLIFALVGIILAVRVVLLRTRWPVVIISACTIVVLTPRSFVFHYWVLSESLYMTVLALFIAFAFRAITNQNQIGFFVFLVISAACLLKLLGVSPRFMLRAIPANLLWASLTAGIL